MTDGDGNASESFHGAPIDFDRLDVVRDRLATADRFSRIVARPTFAPERPF